MLIYVRKKTANVLAAHHLDLFCFCLNTRQLLILLLQQLTYFNPQTVISWSNIRLNIILKKKAKIFNLFTFANYHLLFLLIDNLRNKLLLLVESFLLFVFGVSVFITLNVLLVISRM